MGLFDIFKKNDTPSVVKKVSKREKVLPSVVQGIPQDILNLLWFSDGPLKNIDIDAEEPSTISLSLPVKAGTVDKLGYWPSYKRMSPAERFNYLTWLKDIRQPTDIGNVFTFFYGLERYIMTEKYQEAVSKINLLQKHHNNASFIHYSNVALVYLALTKKDTAFLKSMAPEPKDSTLFILSKAALDKQFTSEEIITMSRSFLWDNQRYIKQFYSKFKDNMEEIMVYKWNKRVYSFPNNIGTIPTTELSLSNISLNPEKTLFKINGEITMSMKVNLPKTILIPNFIESNIIRTDMYSLLKETHEATKKQLAEERKQKRLSKIEN
ncbi:TerB N-terminal domain-containing protein [Enterococcus xiangfangensis]|uniref:TerB N-terminal domain-containing protein n=1 Tax=Enterococcus xiangfangensis TaxID=1296537 RepID=UPI0010F9CDFB|nr:TerB N-terminal domain-containing protein [Enterococcus xiangfangensis]MBM7711451.1 hypothetical protein [Enterococcus xiangfangensis]